MAGLVRKLLACVLCHLSPLAVAVAQVASTATYPHEVVRSYMHVSGSGPWDGLKEACRWVRRLCLGCGAFRPSRSRALQLACQKSRSYLTCPGTSVATAEGRHVAEYKTLVVYMQDNMEGGRLARLLPWLRWVARRFIQAVLAACWVVACSTLAASLLTATDLVIAAASVSCRYQPLADHSGSSTDVH